MTILPNISARRGAVSPSNGRSAPKPQPIPTGRRARRVVLGVSCLAVVAAVICLAAWQLLDARHHMYAGVDDLKGARSALRLDLAGGATGIDGKSRTAILSAAAEFGSARSDLRLWSPLLVRLGWIPSVGPELAAAPPAADAAWYATQSALHLADGLTPVSSALAAHDNRHHLMPRLGAALERSHPKFLAASADAGRLTVALRDLPHTIGKASLDNAAAELRHAAPILSGASHSLAIAPIVLGFPRPHRYLVLLQNPANIAPTGGMIGALDDLTLKRGSVHSSFSSVALPHQITSVSAPLPEALYSPIGYWTLLDSNWSPDFPLSARIARWFYGKDTGRWTDGVIGLLDPGIVRLLGATGALYVPAYGRWVDAGNVESLAQLYVNSTYHGPSRRGTKDTVRKQFLGDVMRALMNRLQSLPAARWPAMGRALAAAVATREIQVYDRRPDVESAVHLLGADGSLKAPPGDFLAVVDFNESDSKLNPYVHESARYRVRVGADLWLDSTLSIRYSVAPSPPNLEGTGPGLGLLGTKHDYEDYLRVYVPRGAQLIGMSGAERWAPLPAYGLTQFGGRFIVREGESRTVTFHYRVPANALAGLGSARYALTVRHQPGASLTALPVTVTGARATTLGTRHAASIDRTLPLDRDAALDLPLGGRLHPRPITLPRTSGPADPYIPFADFRDPKHPL